MKVPLLAILSVCVLGGCGEACGIVDCASYVNVRIEDAAGVAPSTFTGTIRHTGSPSAASPFACTDGELTAAPPSVSLECTDEGFVLIGIESAKFELTVSTSDASFDGTLDPTFRPSYPGGRDCPAACQEADETVVLQ